MRDFFSSKGAVGRRAIALDLPLLAALLYLAARTINPSDFGWVKTNPSPFYLLPLLIGSRYGFLWGIGSGLVAVVLILVGRSGFNPVNWGNQIEATPLFYGMFPLVGAVCGEIQRSLRKRTKQLEEQSKMLAQRMETLDADYALLQESKSELERLLATHDSEYASLDTELRQLFEKEADQLSESILALLNRQCRISDAALYKISGEELQQSARIGSSEHLPDKMFFDQFPIVDLALKEREPASIRDFWGKGVKEGAPHLLAVPFLDSHRNPLALLLVTGLPFMELNRRTIQRVLLICQWAARALDLRHGPVGSFRVSGTLRIYNQSAFQSVLELAVTSYKDYDLPSSIVLFTVPDLSRGQQPLLEELIVPTIRAGDFPAELDLPFPNLVVLLPLSGERGATFFLNRVLGRTERRAVFKNRVQHRIVQLAGKSKAGEVWDQLVRP
jgi:hypothetical protein